MDIDTILLEAEDRMGTAVEYFQRELRGVRTGRATPSLLEYVKVEYYGSHTDLRELAAINVVDANTLMVKPFDPGSKSEIVKAIESAGIGVRAVAEGAAVRVSVPSPSADRRKQLITQVKTCHRANIVLFPIGFAHFQRRNRRDKTLGEGISNPLFYDETFCCRAHLPGVLVTPGHCRFHGQLQRGIVQNDKGIGTAQFQHAFFQRCARLRTNCRPGTHAAGHGNRSNTAIVNRLTDTLVCRINPAKDALRETRIRKNLRDKFRRAENVWCMLEQIAVPGQ